MPYLKFHPHTEPPLVEEPLRFPADRIDQSPRMGLPPAVDAPRDVISEVEAGLDLVDNRLRNLRALVDQFGLADEDDDGPRAA